MTYDTNKVATEQEPFPELYEFQSGTDFQRFTSWSEDLTFRGAVYITRPIKRTGFSFDGKFGAVSCTVTAPLFDQYIAYVSNQPIEPINLKIYRAIKSDLNDYRTIFTGAIKRIAIQKRMGKAEFESRAKLLSNKIPKILYQSYCNWDVFDQDCGANPLDFDVNTSVTVSGSTLSSAVFGTYDDGWFTAGRVLFGSDERWILDHTGDVLTLQIPFDSRLQNGDQVTVYPGCDGNPDTCKNKYNNYDNFLGMPYIPSHNPCLFGFK